jgi:hypothetical protein
MFLPTFEPSVSATPTRSVDNVWFHRVVPTFRRNKLATCLGLVTRGYADSKLIRNLIGHVYQITLRHTVISIFTAMITWSLISCPSFMLIIPLRNKYWLTSLQLLSGCYLSLLNWIFTCKYEWSMKSHRNSTVTCSLPQRFVPDGPHRILHA